MSRFLKLTMSLLLGSTVLSNWLYYRLWLDWIQLGYCPSGWMGYLLRWPTAALLVWTVGAGCFLWTRKRGLFDE
jgi:hypothetical protein